MSISSVAEYVEIVKRCGAFSIETFVLILLATEYPPSFLFPIPDPTPPLPTLLTLKLGPPTSSSALNNFFLRSSKLDPCSIATLKTRLRICLVAALLSSSLYPTSNDDPSIFFDSRTSSIILEFIPPTPPVFDGICIVLSLIRCFNCFRGDVLIVVLITVGYGISFFENGSDLPLFLFLLLRCCSATAPPAAPDSSSNVLSYPSSPN
mmetsp:Transcript_14942/g.32287  ORF Transcript_14942/g.32287 Transcript_14942/m.32287 type:complete len:207 (-) Transcript_14942:579-1199(-)